VPRYIGHDDNNNSSSNAAEEVDLSYYTHDGYEKCLSKKTIIFIGESRVRYQYMHLLSYLKSKKFMKCQDQEKYVVEASTTLPENECHVIRRNMHGLTWNDWLANTTNMLNSNSNNIRSNSISGEEKEGGSRQQISLCDCARPKGNDADQFFENRYTKRNTQYGEINLIYLQNMNGVIKMSEDFPPYSPFFYNNDNTSSTTTTTRCKPGKCARGEKGRGTNNAWAGDMNASLYEIIPKLNATHVFVNLGWDFRSDPSCLLNEFAKEHPSIKVTYISHPQGKTKTEVLHPMKTRLECDDVDVLDRTSMSLNVPRSWFWDQAHVLSILNEEFNHQLIKNICPMKVK